MVRPSHLQTYYQRNMLIGLCVSALLACGAGVYLSTLQALPGQTIPELACDLQPYDKTDSSQTEPGSDGPGSGGFNPYAEQHQGFMGFATLYPRQNVPIPAVTRIPSYDLSPDAPESDATLLSYSPFEGDQTGLYVPDGIGFAGAVGAVRRTEPLNRDIVVVRKVDPEYPYVARMAGKEGQLIVLVYLDSLGRLSEFPPWVSGEGKCTLKYRVAGRRMTADYAYSEDPTDWFFAPNFLRVLPEWRFAPRIENGRPVSSLLRIRYSFCLGLDCGTFRLETLRR
ncbi:MAG: hypothetical protein GY867_01395 [bacterium]|nr:hypothetical protein [bacterium]